MRKNHKPLLVVYNLCLAALLGLTLFSCDDEVTSNFKSHSFHLQLDVPEESMSEFDELIGMEVNIYNTEKDYSIIGISDSVGVVMLEAIESGIYEVTVAKELEDADGINMVFNGRVEIVITEDYSGSFMLDVVYLNDGDFVIREFYYSGCLTPADKQYLDDQYIELYNNSSDTLYADSVLLVELESYGNADSYWESSLSEFIVVKTMFAIPGDGDDYPIAPGEGYIIARDPMNHKSDPNGNPNSPVDLGDADFDIWSDKTPTGDIDFNAPNVIHKLWVDKGNDMAFHSRGGSAVALVRYPGDIDQFISDNLITKGTATSSSKYYCKIRNDYVVDAVEITWNNKLYKRFDNSLDAGSTFIEAGSRSGLAVRRKIKRIVGGRVIYQDTNNSTEDFLHDVIPMPRNYK